jgi:quercetin dioxygenase-like cupin family protein
MAKIDFVRPEERVFVPAPDPSSPVSICSRYPGTTDAPELMEIRFEPDYVGPPHAHEIDEIVVVVEGELRLGSQSYGPGSSAFIPRMTLYALGAGPEGVTFLNFRARQDDSVIPKDEFLARRGELDGTPPD